jgi:tRNA A-37 threonylcarbamoyl transferase component Bud32
MASQGSELENGSARITPAEAAFLAFLAEQEEGAPADFEGLVQRHRALEPELRRLHADWLGVAKVAEELKSAAPRVDTEEFHVAGKSDELRFELASELLKRLARNRTPAGRYERREEIARGGMGIVHRVFDPVLRRQLAMKVILARKKEESPRERHLAMQRALARFLEEAQVTSQLDHPGIVPVHELGIDESGRVYFTMRLVRGRDFRRILELVRDGREGWTRTRALHVLLRVCEAVAYAHSKGVIHRDLKPGNLMVGRFGEVCVMDWGLARVRRRARSGSSWSPARRCRWPSSRATCPRSWRRSAGRR